MAALISAKVMPRLLILTAMTLRLQSYFTKPMLFLPSNQNGSAIQHAPPGKGKIGRERGAYGSLLFDVLVSIIFFGYLKFYLPGKEKTGGSVTC
jgi:hypothetical protein